MGDVYIGVNVTIALEAAPIVRATTRSYGVWTRLHCDVKASDNFKVTWLRDDRALSETENKLLSR